MADNRIAYGLAKKYGIDTTGMSPKEVWEALNEKGIKSDGYDSKASVKNLSDRVEKARRSGKYSKRLDSAVMNKYGSVRKNVDKLGYTAVVVNDGKYQYWIKINKSEDDFEYEIIRRKKI